nr:PREDICTED: inositol polyphosphate 5-phosphatase K-like [Bemisia tabaci]
MKPSSVLVSITLLCFLDSFSAIEMDNLSLYFLTWNVATKSPVGSVRNALDLPKNKDLLPDFYVIGLQEVKAQPQSLVSDSLFDNPWTNAFRYALASHDYVKVKSVRMVGLVLTVFSLRQHLEHLREVQVETTRTGIYGLWGNKGAVTIRLKVYGCSLCFVNSHLAPHDNNLKDRIEDYETILTDQKFASNDATQIMYHDYIFWFGDLNFRINDPVRYSSLEIDRQVNLARKKEGDFKELLKNDQLRQVMGEGLAFNGLSEGDIEFPPTYKFSLNSMEYDLKRRPAWTDRILYKVNENAYENIKLKLTQDSYHSIESYGISDHKPVASRFTIKVFSNHVEQHVEFVVNSQWYIDSENCVQIIFDADVKPSKADWIGVFHDNFTSLDDYVSYSYLPDEQDSDQQCSASSTPSETAPSIFTLSRKMSDGQLELRVTLTDQLISEPGLYRLVYFTKDSHDVLGVSGPISIVSRDSASQKRSLDW